MMHADERFSRETRRALKNAGWTEGRDVSHNIEWPRDIPAFEAARKILSEFGGLKFRTRQSIIEIKPYIHNDTLQEIPFYEEKIGTKLFPIAEVTIGDTLDILVDPDGHIYTLYPFHSVEPLASSFSVALKYLVNGFKIDDAAVQEDLSKIGLAEKAWKWTNRG